MSELSPPEDEALVFFREFVEPTAAEFMAEVANKRRGCLACLVIASMTEHYFYARTDPTGKTRRRIDNELRKFKAQVRQDNNAISLIADVANATRHVGPKSGRLGYGDVNLMERGQVGILRAGWPISGEEVLVGPEREWRLSELVKSALGFWRERLGLRIAP